MNQERLIAATVRERYWTYDDNCARTTLITLARLREVSLHGQVLASATGLHGAGRFGAQCGLVEGSLMMIGILGDRQRLDTQAVTLLCHAWATEFIGRFGSLNCRDLRPGGFRPDDPPHLCEPLTLQAIAFSAAFLDRHFPARAPD